ncbi:hypothetical protein KVR01_010414 [Diaporthe batatas]|uniref:uncharacterized protein n=1 Tax=Diaporthe batatas TaxID=748121 RepID=UPI001D055F7F|nr:uncharacterized protein KVR01_010414 [Diaporthe batatas]KAG8159777.1 hypothetical protein KVR01_010414 [Diaporthe batatas]
MMSLSNPRHAGGDGADGRSTTNTPTERFIAATLRDARMRMEEINKRREQLRTHTSQPMEDAWHSVEVQYWQDSKARLQKIMSENPTGSIRGWGRAFATEEKQFLADTLAQGTQQAFHQHGRPQQEEMMASDREFWGIWRKQLDFLGDLPPVPEAARQPTNTNAAISSSSTTTKKRKASTRPVSNLMLTLDNPASEAVDAQGHSLSPASTTQALNLKSIAAQPPRSPGPFGAPSPVSLASSPDPTIPPPSGVFSKPRYPASKRRKTTAAAAAAGRAAEPAIKAAFTPINSPKPSPQPQPLPAGQAMATTTTEGSKHDTGFQGVTDLVVGEIYQAYYKDATQEGWWMCTPLPWDDWDREIGIDLDFTRADMWRDLPRQQYKTGKGRRKKAILGWKGQFVDGGAKVTQRVFPVLFLDDEVGGPGNLQFGGEGGADPMATYTFPETAMRALPTEWVAAKNIRRAGADVAGGLVHGVDTARRFRERFRARRALKGQGR